MSQDSTTRPPRALGYSTLQLHAGQTIDPTTKSFAPPIYCTSAFAFDDAEHAARLFTFKEPGFIYSRVSNPTLDVFEKRIAALEGGVAAVAVSSGLSAMFMAIVTLASTGDNIISSTSLFGGSYNQFKVALPKFGITVKFVEGDNPQDFEALIDQKTKAIFVECIGNPGYNVAPIPELAEMAHRHGVPLIVDNTFGAGGYYMRPFDYGADIITHSASKWIGGHGTTIAGVVIDSGNFDWEKSGRFPAFTEPTIAYHGLRYVEHFGKKAYAAKMRLETIRDIGMTLNPFAGWLMLQGLETLDLRAQKHSDNALTLAKWLEVQPQVTWVSFLGLPSHVHYERAKTLMRKNTWGAVLSFGVHGGFEFGSGVVNNLKLVSNVANVGDAKTLIIHPASTTHQQLTEDEQISAGVTPDLLRVSVGLEDIEDIIADFMESFAVVFKV